MRNLLGGRKVHGEPLFFQRYGVELRRWVRCLAHHADSVDAIVAISRKGPRLLELLVQYGYLDSKILEKVIVEFAAGLEQEQYKRILLTDDSLIHGSTYLRVRNTLRQTNENVEIIDAPFAVGKSSFPQARDLIDCFGMTMREEELERYVIHLSQAFHAICKPLLTAYPVIEVELDDSTVEIIDNALTTFAASVKGSNDHRKRIVAMIGGDRDAYAEFHSWHVAVPGIVKQKSRYNDIATLKFYLDDRGDRPLLRVTPCTQISFSLVRDAEDEKTNWEKNILDRLAPSLRCFCYDLIPRYSHQYPREGENVEDRMRDLFRRTYLLETDADASVPAFACSSGRPYSEVPPFVLQHMATLHNYAASLQLFVHHEERLREVFTESKLVVPQEPEQLFQLSEADLRLFVGPDAAQKHDKILSDLLKEPERKAMLVGDSMEAIDSESFPGGCADFYAGHLSEQQTLLTAHFPEKKEHETDESDAQLKRKVAMAFELYFRRQHYDVEIHSRRASTTYRLFFGNNYESLEKVVLELADIDASQHARACRIIRRCFEYNIDLVTVVPFYYLHRQSYSFPIKNRLQVFHRTNNHVEQPRYETIRFLTKMFRVGEGVPDYIRKYYAKNLLLYVFSQYFRPQNRELANKEFFYDVYMKLLFRPELIAHFASLAFFKEIFTNGCLESDLDDKIEIPLLIASYQEQLSICPPDTIDHLQTLAIEMKCFADEHPHLFECAISQDTRNIFVEEFLAKFQQDR